VTTATTPPRLPLTERQREVLRAIADLYLAGGRMPSYREVMARLGMGSPNGLFCHLTVLERKGYVRTNRAARGHVTARAFEVVGLAEAVRPAAEAFLADLIAHAPTLTE
jgi:repressor LexA